MSSAFALGVANVASASTEKLRGSQRPPRSRKPGALLSRARLSKDW